MGVSSLGFLWLPIPWTGCWRNCPGAPRGAEKAPGKPVSSQRSRKGSALQDRKRIDNNHSTPTKQHRKKALASPHCCQARLNAEPRFPPSWAWARHCCQGDVSEVRSWNFHSHRRPQAPAPGSVETTWGAWTSPSPQGGIRESLWTVRIFTMVSGSWNSHSHPAVSGARPPPTLRCPTRLPGGPGISLHLAASLLPLPERCQESRLKQKA